MKARTLIEKEVAKINSSIKENISLCDKKWSINNVDNMYHSSGCKSNEYFIYFTLSEIRKEWCIDRLYRIYRFDNKNIPVYLIMEVGRTFVNDDKILYFTKQRFLMNSWSPYDTFSFHSNIELRKNDKNFSGYGIGEVFDLSQCERRRHGGTRINCIKENPSKLNKILRVPYGETLYNHGEYALIHKLIIYPKIKEFLASIRIAKKHGFVFTEENIPLWFDMVEAIIYTKNDNHNPKFVAPTDLQEMHNYFISKSQRKREKEIRRRNELALIKQEKEALEAIEREKKDNEEYIQRRRRFFDLDISNDKFDVHVLRDINDFFEEGKNMSHCVFSNKYYNKVNSLILSCRNKKGERVETVEVDLKEFKVTQCYGFKDNFTSHHKEILDLMKNNMNKIRMCFRGRYKSKQQYLQAI